MSSSPRRTAVLWDMDGTFIDTEEWHFQTWRTTLRGRAPNFDRALFVRCFGMNNAGSLEIFLGGPVAPELAHELSAEKEELFRAGMATETKPFPGVERWFAWLQERGIPQAVASSADLTNIALALKTFHLAPYFDLSFSGSALPSKPAPDVFLGAARALGADVRRCLVIEDSRQGLAAGRAAGAVTLARQSGLQILPAEATAITNGYLGDPAATLEPLLARLHRG